MKKLLFIAVLLCLGASSAADAAMGLSDKELAWLDKHPQITIGMMSDYPPQSYKGQGGKLEGVDPGVFKLLDDLLPGRFKVVADTWSNLLEAALDKRIDVLMKVTPSEERGKHFAFTRPYMSVPHAIVAREKGLHFGTLDALRGHTVGLEKGAFLVNHLKANHPEVEIKEFTGALPSLKAVQSGEVDAYIGNKMVVDYLMEANNINDLDFHGVSDDSSETNVIAVRGDWPELADILDRALSSIPHEKIHATMDHWGKGTTTATNAPDIKLTKEEIVWIQQHPKIIVGAETDWAPYDYVNNGKATGFANDYMRLVAEKAGLNLQFIHGPSWEELIKKARAREIDLLPCVLKHESREDFLDFTEPYLMNTSSIVVNQKNTAITSLDDLKGRSLAGVRGYAGNKLIAEKYPEINITLVNSPAEALIAVSEGRADAYLDYLGTINYLRREYSITNLRVTDFKSLPEKGDLSIGIRKDWPTLTGILNKAMAEVTHDELEVLKNKWLLTGWGNASPSIDFTYEEQAWMLKNPTLLVGVSNDWPPYLFMSNDKPAGFSSDYLQLLAKKAGLDLKFTRGLPWNELISMAKQQELDVVPALIKTDKRSKHLNFTRSYLEKNSVLAVNKNLPGVKSLDDMQGLKLACIERFGITRAIKEQYPDITYVHVESPLEALSKVNEGTADAYVDYLGVINYLRRENLLKNLTVSSADATPFFNSDVSISVRKDWPLLLQILEKAMNDVSPEELEGLKNKWLLLGDNEPQLNLTEEEKTWIDEHPEILVATEMDWPPYSFVANGKEAGFSNELIKILARKAGLNLRFVHGFSWDEILQNARQKKVDVVHSLVKIESREAYLDFTKSYLDNNNVLIVREQASDIDSVEDLRGKTLAIVEGFVEAEVVLKRYPDIKPFFVGSATEGLIAVSEGHADGFIEILGVINYLRREHQITNLKITNLDALPFLDTPLTIAVRNDWSILRNIFNKAMEAVSQEEYEDLKSRWLHVGGKTSEGFVLTQAELSLAQSMGTLKVAAPLQMAPFYPISAEKPEAGLYHDYLRIFTDKLGLKYELVTGSWKEMVEKTARGEIDLMPLINDTKERRKHFAFANPYLKIPYIIATRRDAPYYPDIGDLEGVTVGVGRGYHLVENLKQIYPELLLSEYGSTEDALRALESGDIQALIINNAIFSHYTGKLGLRDSLWANNTTEYEDVLTTGVRTGLKDLVPLLNKTISSITPKEHDLIMDKWTNLPVVRQTNWKMVWQTALGSILLLAIISFWSAKMAREIRRRREAEARLTKSDERFEQAFSNVADIVVVLGEDLRYIYANQSGLDYVNLPKEKVYNKRIKDVFPRSPGFAETWESRLKETFESGQSAKFEDEFLLHGQERFSEATLSPLMNDYGKVYAVSLVYRDTTDKVKHDRDMDRFFNIPGCMVCTATLDGTFKKMSPAFFDTLQYEEAEMIGHSHREFLHPDDRERTREAIEMVAATGEDVMGFENRYICKDGSTKWLSWTTKPIVEEDTLLAMAFDITSGKKNEEALKRFSETQAVLLREVNHRVKNSLSAIISMLHMEGDKSGGFECSGYCSQPLASLERRIASLLTIHSMLSSSKWQSLKVTDICEKVIMESVIGILGDNSFELNVNDSDLVADSDKAHSLALILNELAVNSSKYASSQTSHLTITVTLTTGDGEMGLLYRDNGAGFNEASPEQNDRKGIGLEIIRGLVTMNLNGKLEQYNDGGACTKISIPLHNQTGAPKETNEPQPNENIGGRG